MEQNDRSLTGKRSAIFTYITLLKLRPQGYVKTGNLASLLCSTVERKQQPVKYVQC